MRDRRDLDGPAHASSYAMHVSAKEMREAEQRTSESVRERERSDVGKRSGSRRETRRLTSTAIHRHEVILAQDDESKHTCTLHCHERVLRLAPIKFSPSSKSEPAHVHRLPPQSP